MSNDIHGGREPHENCSDPTAQLRNGAIRRAGPRRAIPHAVHVHCVETPEGSGAYGITDFDARRLDELTIGEPCWMHVELMSDPQCQRVGWSYFVSIGRYSFDVNLDSNNKVEVQMTDWPDERDEPAASRLRRELAETQRKVEAWRDAATRDADPNVVHIDAALNALREVDELLSAEVNDCECVKCQNDPMRVALGIVRAALARATDGPQ